MSHKLTQNQIIEVIEKYNSGLSAGILSKTYNITPTSIYALMKRRGINRRSYSSSSRKYTLNEEYFNVIDSSDKAYFLGFLMADGYNNEKRGVIELSCAEKDKEILDKLNNLINSNKPIRFVESKDVRSYRIDWCSKKLSNELLKYGCMQTKSLKLEFPKLDDKLISHFIRGYFDGDGCISYSYSLKNNALGTVFKVVVNFVSTENFCLYLKEYFEKNININSSISCRHPENNNTNRTLNISGAIQVSKLMEWMYKDATIYLQRKKDKFEESIKIRQNRKETMDNIRIGRRAITN